MSLTSAGSAPIAYNVLLIPVAAGVLYPFNGTLLNPSLTAAMAMSSVSVVTKRAAAAQLPRPATAGDLRPSVGRRLADPAYLTGVAAGAGVTVDVNVPTDASTGTPITTVRPYLAAAGHIVVMPVDGRGFAHDHAEANDTAGNPVFALPAQTLGPGLDVHAAIPAAGRYRLWGQFRTGDGTVIATTFTVDAAQAAQD